MITEKGVVEKITSNKAFIRINRSSACAGCQSRGACNPTENKEMIVEAINLLNARVGDHVQISVPAGSLLKATFLVYFLPVVALVAGAIIGSEWAAKLGLDSTLSSVLCGFLAMAVTFVVAKWFDRHASSKAQYWPKVTRILPPLTQPDGSKSAHSGGSV